MEHCFIYSFQKMEAIYPHFRFLTPSFSWPLLAPSGSSSLCSRQPRATGIQRIKAYSFHIDFSKWEAREPPNKTTETRHVSLEASSPQLPVLSQATQGALAAHSQHDLRLHVPCVALATETSAPNLPGGGGVGVPRFPLIFPMQGNME